VPDHAALSGAADIVLLDRLGRAADPEELLMARNLADAAIEHGEAADQIEQPLGAAECVNRPVLGRDRAVAFGGHGVEVGACASEVTGEDGVLLHRGEHTVGKGCDGLVGVFLVAPCLPEPPRRPDRRIARLVPVHSDQQLGEVEKLRDVVLVLVADQLAVRLLQAFGRPFVLDHQDRDAVHERDDIAALGLARRCPLDRELCGDVEDVVRWPLPIDVAERVALRVAVDGLRDGRAEDERVVDVLVRSAQTLQPIWSGLQPAHRLMRVLEVEGILTAAMREAVDAHELLGEHIVQHHVPQPPAAQAQCLVLRERHKPERHQ